MRRDYITLRTETVDGHVLLVTLNRPEVSNAINTQMGRDLLDLWSGLIAAPGDVRAVVLTGAGDRAFCAGGDLKERDGMTREEWQAQHADFRTTILDVARLPGAGDRRRERACVRRRSRTPARLRLLLRRQDRALRADRSNARDHAGGRGHAVPAARGGRAPRQGDHLSRQAVHGR